MEETEKLEIEVIEVTPDSDGRVIIELYGQTLEIHDNMFDEDGVAILKKFGKEYQIVKPVEKKKRTKKKTEPITIGEVLEEVIESRSE